MIHASGVSPRGRIFRRILRGKGTRPSVFDRKAHTMLSIAKVSGAALATLALTIPAANAAVTFDPVTGTGFVGKGDVQNVLGYNNSHLQKNASTLVFTSQRSAEQALSQTASQTANEYGTQTVTRTLSCVVDTQRKTFLNEGTRAGERTGERTGSRTGSRYGTLAGNIASTVAFEARVKNQITGFDLRGFQTQAAFVPTGEPAWGDLTFGEWSFTAWSWGETEWSGWVSEPGENPADCLSSTNGHVVTELEDVTTVSANTDDGVVEHAVQYGDAVHGAPVALAGSPAQLFVNGAALN